MQEASPTHKESTSLLAQQAATSSSNDTVSAEKYLKLKRRFSSLREEYLKTLVNWEQTNDQVQQLTSERKFLRRKLECFVKSRQIQASSITDEDLTSMLLTQHTPVLPTSGSFPLTQHLTQATPPQPKPQELGGKEEEKEVVSPKASASEESPTVVVVQKPSKDAITDVQDLIVLNKHPSLDKSSPRKQQQHAAQSKPNGVANGLHSGKQIVNGGNHQDVVVEVASLKEENRWTLQNQLSQVFTQKSQNGDCDDQVLVNGSAKVSH